MTERLAIVAALEREIRPLVRAWHTREEQHAGRTFRFYENANTVLICGGIGSEAARRAAEAIIALYHPTQIYSAGFAGALILNLRVGDIFVPRRVISAADGSSVDTGQGDGVLISFSSVASPEQKTNLAKSYGAQAVDMEASAVARAAEARGIPFAAVKAISDEHDFALPPMDRFINSNGQFNSAQFAMFAALRPWIWGATLRLARNSHRASVTLCRWLEQVDKSAALTDQHPVAEAVGSVRQP